MIDWESFTYDQERLREAVRQEKEADCDISAGYDYGVQLGNVPANPEGYSHLMMLRSIMLNNYANLETLG